MNLIKSIINHIAENIAEYYILALLTVALPLLIGWFTDIRFTLVSSVLIQITIGVLYITRSNK